MRTFRAMNTDVTIDAPDLGAAAERDLARAAAQLFHETERRFSRFHPDSELARLNRAVDAHPVSSELLALLVRARAHAIATDGIFEPAIGGAMCASGYDRSFAPGSLDRDAAVVPAPAARIAMLEIDAGRARVTRPPDLQLDFGGFLKGLTADRAAALAPGAVVVDAGGDGVLRGETGWVVDVEDPFDPAQTIASLVVRDRAVATSAPNRRRWRRAGREMHHLLDPRTGAPARTDLAQVTVLAPTAEEADVMAKVAFILGAATGRRVLERRGLAGVLVMADRSLRTVGTVELADA